MTNCQLIFRNLKRNIQDNVLLAAGIIFNLIFVFCFLFLEAAVESAASLQIAWNYGNMVRVVRVCAIVGMISGFFLIMSIAFPYMKRRIREYSLLMILGIEKKEMYLLLGIEYMIMWGIILFVGILFGTLLSALVYVILILSGCPIGEMYWPEVECDVWGKVALLSIGYIVCALIYLLVRMDNRNLSELAVEVMKPDKMKNVRKNMKIGIVGLTFVLFSLILQFPTKYLFFLDVGEDERLLIAFVSLIIGMYLLIASGMSIVLSCVKCNKGYYYERVLSVRSMMFRVFTYKNMIFAIVLINFAVLFFVGDGITIFSNEESDYSWRYPHDFVGSMSKEDAEKWESFCWGNGEENRFISMPYIDMTSETKARFIGISESAYQKITSKKMQLEKNQMLLCIQHDKSEDGIALEEWKEERNVVFRFDGEIKEYEIKEKEVNSLIIGGFFDGGLVNVAVFENGEYEGLLEKQEAYDFLVIQDYKEGKEHVMEQKVQGYKEKCPQISCITKIEAFSIEKLVDRISNVVSIFCALCIALAGLTMLGVKLFSEIPAFEKKYMFLSNVGMDREQIKREIRKEVRNMVFIPAALGVCMATVYKVNALGRFIQMNPKYHFYTGNEVPAFIWVMSRDWLFVVIIFCFIQLIYGIFMSLFIRKRIVLTIAEKEETYEKKQRTD